MAERPTPAGGALIALGAIAGAIIGLIAEQPTLGFLTGIGIGIAMALLIWWRSR